MAENPNPTRMELLKAKTRVKLARKGHKLLKQKRDALVLEFFKILGKAQDLRSELNLRMSNAYGALAVAQAYHSMQEIEEAARQQPELMSRLLKFLAVSRNLERIADYSVNIAEDVIYMVKGTIIRHRGHD